MTPAQELHEAIKTDNAARIAELLDGDSALVHGGGANGMPPLMLAIYMRKLHLAELLISRGAVKDVFAAAALGDTEAVRAALKADDVLLNMNSSDGWTPLHLACFFGHLTTAEMLLGMGADVKARSANALHNTPLNAASAGRHREICALLLKHGAEVNAAQEGGFTPLHAAAANGDLDLVRLPNPQAVARGRPGAR